LAGATDGTGSADGLITTSRGIGEAGIVGRSDGATYDGAGITVATTAGALVRWGTYDGGGGAEARVGLGAAVGRALDRLGLGSGGGGITADGEACAVVAVGDAFADGSA
jgi:hypothetical protein